MLGYSAFIFQFIVLFYITTLFGFSIKEISSQLLQPVSYSRKQEGNNCPGKFQCASGQCISSFDVCDGAKNCDDGSDENQYICIKSNITCPKSTFRCAYGACIDGGKTCDGIAHCADNSDELLLECPGVNWIPKGNTQKCKSNEFQCRNGHCINTYSTCDGTPDCPDKSDETITQCNQESFGCLQHSFRCAYGACIDESKKCNGEVNCVDGSDEDSMLCGYNLDKPVRKPPDSIPPGKCLLPQFSIGTKYARYNCSNFEECVAIEENEIINPFQHIFINCKEGFALRNVDNNFVAICVFGKWQPENTACVKLCEPLKSTSLKVFCEYDGAKVNCEKPVRAGTTAKFTCREGYQQELSGTYFEDSCQPSGNWFYSGAKRCTFKCGVLNSQDKLISDGVTANRTYHPWNAGIYRVLKNGTILHVCGGTLITPFSVITAAHCVTLRSDGRVVATSKFRITFAKHYIKYDDKRDTEAEYRNVSRIHVPLAYQGESLRYLFDIAILELTSSVPLGSSIMPVCVDENNENFIRSYMLGTVVGWGLNSFNLPSEELQKAEVSYITLEECRNFLDKDKNQITNDKFCTLKRNGSNTAVQQGDSGSGVTFEFEGKHYIYGLVSTKVNGMIDTFTDLRFPNHLKYINEIMKNVTRNNGTFKGTFYKGSD
ncbi:coagulation factor VII-like isoform X2 [Lycorma delicatula]|uniref:coagulation factor VII-like isoform X2 n=1 Tax=Lycorma delicatula TaxID=130591 RepID=UPI003F510966